MKKLLIFLVILATAFLGYTQKGDYAEENYNQAKRTIKVLQIQREQRLASEQLLLRVRRYLERFDSPMVGSEKELIASANNWGVDYRLFLAIARKESQLGKRACNFNPFGIASCRVSYDSWADSYEGLGRLLMTSNYYRKWRQTGDLYDLMSVYCPESDNCNTRLYVSQLTEWMGEI